MAKARRSHLSHTDREFIIAQINQLRLWLPRVTAHYAFAHPAAEKAREARSALDALLVALGAPPDKPVVPSTPGRRGSSE